MLIKEKAIQARFTGPEFEQIENWRRAQEEIPAIGKTLRTLALLGIKASMKQAPTKDRAA
jgi:hypothetical protein